MALSAEEGAKALYRLIYERDSNKPEPKRTNRPLIGVKSVEELRAEAHRRAAESTKGAEKSKDKAEKERGRAAPTPRHDSAAHEACAVETAAKRKKLQWDEQGRPIRECVECHGIKGIIGRGLCVKCYWRQPDVKERKRLKMKAAYLKRKCNEKTGE
jgi:Zn ribbon nucleic-acid-binding protein